MSANKSVKIVFSGEKPLLQKIDLEEFRHFNRKKTKKLVDKRMTEEEAVDKFVKDGDCIGFELYGTVRCPMSLTRALVRSGKKDFRLAGQGVHEVDLILAADLVREIDITYVGLEVYGTSNLLRRRVESGQITKVVEWSNAAISWRFKAAAMGVPFLPCRSMLGTDTLVKSAAKVIECPFTQEKIALLPALILDVGFIHVSRADKFGNCQIDGISGFAFEMARASKRLLISAEEIVDNAEIRRHPDRTIIPYYLVDAVIQAPYGSWPGEMTHCYERDEEHYKMFIKQSENEESTKAYMDEWVYGVKNHQELLSKIGNTRLEDLRIKRG